MQSFDALQAASHALSIIGANGYSIDVTTDFDAVPGIAEELGKPHLTPLLSPGNHDFSTQTAFWLVLRDPDGRPEGCSGARLEDIGDDEISDHLRRVFSRHYPNAGPINVTLSNTVQKVLDGRLAYIGDLYMRRQPARGLGNASGIRLAAMMGLMHALVALEWKVNAAYSFITERDALRGAPAQYGYTMQLPMQKSWGGRPPKNRYDTEWMIILPAADRRAVFRRLAWSNS